MFLQNHIDKTAQHTRDRWLIFAIIRAAYSIVTLFIPRENPALNVKNPALPIIISLNVIIFFLLYNFAYRKPGTRLLTYTMFSNLFGLGALLLLSDTIMASGPRILNYCLSAVDFFLAFGGLYLSFQLRKVNLNDKLLRKTSQKSNKASSSSVC